MRCAALLFAFASAGCSLVFGPSQYMGDAGGNVSDDAAIDPCSVLALEGQDDDSAQTDPSDAFDLTSFTLEAWVRPNADALIGARNIAGHWDVEAVPPGGGYMFYLYDGIPRVGIACTDSGFAGPGAEDALAVDRWAHLAVTFDTLSQNAELYVDGVRVGMADVTCSSPFARPSAPFTVALFDPMGGRPFSGRIDEVRLSSIVRYIGGSFTPERDFTADENTVALYHFDEEGPTFLDASSAGRNLMAGSVSVRRVSECRD